jgi:hypothetical protein
MEPDSEAVSLHEKIELTTVVTLQVLRVMSAARVERETALAILTAAKAHVEHLPAFSRI